METRISNPPKDNWKHYLVLVGTHRSVSGKGRMKSFILALPCPPRGCGGKKYSRTVPPPLTERLRRVQQGYGACSKVTRRGAGGAAGVQQGYAPRGRRVRGRAARLRPAARPGGGGAVAVQQGCGPCIKVTHYTFSDSERQLLAFPASQKM